MTCPIALAKAATPWWMLAIHDYTALEILPVRNVNWTGQPLDSWPNLYPADHATWCQPYEPHEAHFWSVYGRLKNGCIECFEDFPDEAEAIAFAARNTIGNFVTGSRRSGQAPFRSRSTEPRHLHYSRDESRGWDAGEHPFDKPQAQA